MVQFNFADRTIKTKVVYYGPAQSGKTTNLEQIHRLTDPSGANRLISLNTAQDRTLFFDLLPLEVGIISGMRVRLQLYTVPGQVFYNTTRRMVLKGADGIVFVADSQVAAFDATVESFSNLKANMAELGMSFADIPLVFQFNKRDLRNIVPVDRLLRSLNPGGGAPSFEASAVHGVGVFETLKAISRLALGALRQKVVTESRTSSVAIPRKTPTPSTPPRTPAPTTASREHGSALEDLLGPDNSVDVEFAEEDPSRKTVKPVPIQDSSDILQQLENLRQNTGSVKPPPKKPRTSEASPASAGSKHRTDERPTPAARPAPKPAVRPSPVPPLPAPEPVRAARRLARRAAIEVPRTLLEGVTEMRVHLALVRDGKEQLVKDVSRANVPEVGSAAPITLHLDLEVRPKR